MRGKKSKAAKAREAQQQHLAQQARRNRHLKEIQGGAQVEEKQQIQEKLSAKDADLDRYCKEVEAKARIGIGPGDEDKYTARLLEAHKQRRLPGPVGAMLDAIEGLKDPATQEKLMREPEEADFPADGEDIGINFYEMDVTTGIRRKVDYFGTVESRKRAKETNKMIEQWENDPDYDDAELNKRMMDFVIADPAFAAIKEELQEIKDDILTKEEIAEIEAQAEKDFQPVIAKMNDHMRRELIEAFTEMLNDPEVGDAKASLEAVLEKLPITEDLTDPNFHPLLEETMVKIDSIPKLHGMMIARAEAQRTPEGEAALARFEQQAKDLDAMLNPPPMDLDEDGCPSAAMQKQVQDELYQLMEEMRGLMKGLGLEANLDELEKAIARPPIDIENDDNGINFNEDEMDVADFAAKLTRLAEIKSREPLKPDLEEDKEQEPEEDEDEEDISPELKAKVDKIMEDPHLIEKLIEIQKIIAEAKASRDPNDLTQIDADLAPDPYEMDDSQTTTIAKQMAIAKADPEHRAAMSRLQVRLQPPFNVSPTLKKFNQALTLAYVGANDDVRRVLWRCYMKARNLPTFLQNMNDDAWDMVYYSQAVKWVGNQNRTAHLKVVLGDLKRVGRDGPPTHPSTLGQGKARDAEDGDGEAIDFDIFDVKGREVKR